MGLLLSDLLLYAVKALTERRLRAALTIIGISIGPLALVMMTSVVSGYTSFVESQITGLGQNLIVLFPEKDYRFTEKDLEFIRSIDGVRDVGPFYVANGVIRTPSGEKEATIYAVDLDLVFSAISGLDVVEGSLPSATETTSAVIGYNIAFDQSSGERLYSVGDAIQVITTEVASAGNIKIKRIYVRVSAILEEYGGAMFLSPDTTIFLPLQAGRRLLGLKDWSGILVLAESPSLVDKITKELREAYRDTVRVISFIEIARVVNSVTAAMNFITFSTSLSAFAVAAAGIAATMITSVIERTREIGVLKALGFTDRQVMSLILCEGVVMSLIGCLIGMALGVIGANILASKGFTLRGTTEVKIYAPPLITPELLLKTLAITLAIGVLGAIFPAYRASKIPPAVALRYE